MSISHASGDYVYTKFDDKACMQEYWNALAAAKARFYVIYPSTIGVNQEDYEKVGLGRGGKLVTVEDGYIPRKASTPEGHIVNIP